MDFKMKQKWLFVVLLSFFGLVSCNSAQTVMHKSVSVYYAGPDDGVKTALDLAAQAQTVAWAADPAQAEVWILNGEIPDPQAAAAHLEGGGGAILI
ncbi:MAG TPA: hypothetical protein DEH25_04640, partial [Chloroflexi bacterium]|nr:hypothetical protein [Chloroflexota bacterium]